MVEWMTYSTPDWYEGCEHFDSEEKARERYEELKKVLCNEGGFVYLLNVVEEFKLPEKGER